MNREQEERFNQGEVIATTTSGTEIRIALRNIPGLKGWINELLKETTSKPKEEIEKRKTKPPHIGDERLQRNQALQEVLDLINKNTKE